MGRWFLWSDKVVVIAKNAIIWNLSFGEYPDINFQLLS